MKTCKIVNSGIIVLIVAGCASSSLIPYSVRELSSITDDLEQVEVPKSLAALSCHEGQRVVIEVTPVESPDVAAIANRRLIDLFPSIPMAIPTGSNFYNLTWIILPKSSPEDLTTEFRKDIGLVLGSIDLQQLLLSRAEKIIKPLSSCNMTFIPTMFEMPREYNSLDKIITIGFYFMFTGNLASPPSIKAYLSTMVMTGENVTELAKHAGEIEKIMAEMKELEPYVRVTNKPPDIVKLKQYAVLGKKIGDSLIPCIDGAGTVNCESPSRSTDEWLANGGVVAKEEISAMMDRLIDNVAGILFK